MSKSKRIAELERQVVDMRGVIADLFRRLSDARSSFNENSKKLKQLGCKHEKYKYSRVDGGSFLLRGVFVCKTCCECGMSSHLRPSQLEAKTKRALIDLGIMYKDDFPKPVKKTAKK